MIDCLFLYSNRLHKSYLSVVVFPFLIAFQSVAANAMYTSWPGDGAAIVNKVKLNDL